MLTVNEIIANLDPNQVPIPGMDELSDMGDGITFSTHIGNVEYRQLPTFFENILKEHSQKYCYIDVERSNSIINSTLSILDEMYMLIDGKKEGRNYVKKLRQKMSGDMDDEDLYHKFNYQKNRKIKKSELQQALLSDSKNLDHNLIFNKFLVDYFSINIIIFEMKGGEFQNISYILSTDESLEVTPFNPTIFMLHKHGEQFYPILKKDGSSSIHLYPDDEALKYLYHTYTDLFDNDKESIKNIKDVKVKVNSKMKLGKIQELAIKHGITIKKQSTRTNNMIKKTKRELIEELENTCIV